MHFDCRLAQSVCLRSEVALVKRRSAFLLRRLAQSVVLGSGVWHFSSKFLHSGSCDMLTRILLAQARAKFGPRFWAVAFSLYKVALAGVFVCLYVQK